MGDTSATYYVDDQALQGPPTSRRDSVPVLVGPSEKDTVPVSGLTWSIELQRQDDGPGLRVTAAIRNDTLVISHIEPL